MDAFPSRKEILENKSTSYQKSIINEIKSIDIDKVDFSNSDFKPKSSIIEKQKVFFWIRLYLKEENSSINPNDIIVMKYLRSGEELETKFICYAKTTLNKDSQGEIVNYDTEDDKKVLCLMVDSDKINYDDGSIPFIRTLFKTSRFYEY